MSDDNNVQKPSSKSQQYFLAGFVFALLGFVLHLLFFVGALSSLVLVQTTRQNKKIASILSLVVLVVVFGYTLGKDPAVRDNARDAKSALNAEETP